jgi:hypothetical protein
MKRQGLIWAGREPARRTGRGANREGATGRRFQRGHALTVTGDIDERTLIKLERETATKRRDRRGFPLQARSRSNESLPGVESRPEVSTTEKLVDLLMQRIQ